MVVVLPVEPVVPAMPKIIHVTANLVDLIVLDESPSRFARVVSDIRMGDFVWP